MATIDEVYALLLDVQTQVDKLLFDASGYVKSAPQVPVTVAPSQLTDGTIYRDKTATLGEDIEIVRGNTMTLTFPLATGWDLTSPAGRKAKCSIKATATAAQASAIVDRDCTILGAQSCSIVLTPAETAVVGAYVGAVEILESDDRVVGEAFFFNVRIIQDRRQ